ncbi:unnamed protein product [Paramecium sonneborni]|uniref:Transmembrane protein n=1 Tax=Paramecium sonneborni TaxID=65129 RepID=A0A8S1RX41_9CILI|nr:unnamed protein product [Paramecium sonneborni]
MFHVLNCILQSYYYVFYEKNNYAQLKKYRSMGLHQIIKNYLSEIYLDFLDRYVYIPELRQSTYQKDKFYLELLYFGHNLWQFINLRQKDFRRIYFSIQYYGDYINYVFAVLSSMRQVLIKTLAQFSYDNLIFGCFIKFNFKKSETLKNVILEQFILLLKIQSYEVLEIELLKIQEMLVFIKRNQQKIEKSIVELKLKNYLQRFTFNICLRINLIVHSYLLIAIKSYLFSVLLSIIKRPFTLDLSDFLALLLLLLRLKLQHIYFLKAYSFHQLLCNNMFLILLLKLCMKDYAQNILQSLLNYLLNIGNRFLDFCIFIIANLAEIDGKKSLIQRYCQILILDRR